MGEIIVRPPVDEAEIKQLWRLNHSVFANELRLHENHTDGILIDKFHEKNLYFAGWDNGKAVGMICAHWQEPFSAVERFGNVMRKVIVPGRTAEIRLFAVMPEYRHTSLAARLGATIFKILHDEKNIRWLIISGVAEQKEFYEHIGFKAVGEPVNEEHAVFYPMLADLPPILRRCAIAVARCTK